MGIYFKKNESMKKFLSFVMSFLLISSVAVTAQQSSPQKERKGEKMEMKQGQKPMISADKIAEKMAKDLGLTDAEKVKVQALFEKQNEKRKLQVAELKKVQAEQAEKTELERKAMKAELEKIIGAEKLQKLELQKSALQQKMKNGQGKHKPMMNKKHNKNDVAGKTLSPAKMAERMTEKLSLTNEQKASVQALFEKQMATGSKSKDEIKKFMDEKKAQMEANGKLFKAEMEKIVGPEKMQKMQSEKAQMQKKMAFKHRHAKVEMMKKMQNKHRHAKVEMMKRMHRQNVQKDASPQLAPDKMATKMAEKLGLTDAEKAKVQALFEKQAEKRSQHQAEIKKIRETEMAKVEADRKLHDAEMLKIIGTERLKKLETLRAGNMERFKGGKERK